MVEIEGVDINACGGTHTASLAELQVSSPSVHTYCTCSCSISGFAEVAVPPLCERVICRGLK